MYHHVSIVMTRVGQGTFRSQTCWTQARWWGLIVLAVAVIAALMVRGTREQLLPTQGQAALAAH